MDSRFKLRVGLEVVGEAQPTELQAPKNLIISIGEYDPDGDGTIDNFLQWSSVEGASSYRVEFRYTGESSNEFTSLGPDVSTTYFITTYQFETGYTYHFRVKAISGSQESEWSNEISYTP